MFCIGVMQEVNIFTFGMFYYDMTPYSESVRQYQLVITDDPEQIVTVTLISREKDQHTH